MVLRSQRDGWAAPGTQTPYKRDHRDHRRTRSRAARWNAGTWPVADRGEVWVCGARLPASKFGRGCVSSLWWRSRTAHCCLLARGRMSVVRSWFVHDSPSPLGTQRQRQPLPVEIFEKNQIIHPALLRGRERCTYPLPKQFPLSLGCPSRGLSLLRLPPVDGGQDGRGGLPTPSSTAPLLEAAAAAVREQGWMQGAALGDEQAGRCNRRTGRAAAVRRGRKC